MCLETRLRFFAQHVLPPVNRYIFDGPRNQSLRRKNHPSTHPLCSVRLQARLEQLHSHLYRPHVWCMCGSYGWSSWIGNGWRSCESILLVPFFPFNTFLSIQKGSFQRLPFGSFPFYFLIVPNGRPFNPRILHFKGSVQTAEKRNVARTNGGLCDVAHVFDVGRRCVRRRRSTTRS